MSHCPAGVTFYTEFPTPPDCPREGRIACKVAGADCEVLDVCGGVATFRVRLVLRLHIRHGRCRCSFLHEVVLEDCIALGPCICVADCEVVTATCRCVLSHGKIRCSGAAALRFLVPW